MPNAKVVVAEFKEPMQLYNMAYWHADFVRRQAGVDICLLPRKTLYDEHDSFAAGEVNVQRLLGWLYDRYVITSTVKGSDLLEFCDTDDVRDRFNPFHHRGRPFSGDAMFFSGFDVTFEPATERVEFSIEPETLYRVAIPWPFTRGDIGRYRHQLPPRWEAEQANFAAGLSLKSTRVLPSTTRELLVREGIAGGLDFYVKFPQLRMGRRHVTPGQERGEATRRSPGLPGKTSLCPKRTQDANRYQIPEARCARSL